MSSVNAFSANMFAIPNTSAVVSGILAQNTQPGGDVTTTFDIVELSQEALAAMGGAGSQNTTDAPAQGSATTIAMFAAIGPQALAALDASISGTPAPSATAAYNNKVTASNLLIDLSNLFGYLENNDTGQSKSALVDNFLTSVTGMDSSGAPVTAAASAAGDQTLAHLLSEIPALANASGDMGIFPVQMALDALRASTAPDAPSTTNSTQTADDLASLSQNGAISIASISTSETAEQHSTLEQLSTGTDIAQTTGDLMSLSQNATISIANISANATSEPLSAGTSGTQTVDGLASLFQSAAIGRAGTSVSGVNTTLEQLSANNTGTSAAPHSQTAYNNKASATSHHHRHHDGSATA